MYPNYLVDRFGQYVVLTEDECHVWVGSTNQKGYGKFNVPLEDGRQTTIAAHRFAWQAAHGEIPEGMHLHHVCRTKRCVNLSHLELLSAGDHGRLENLRRIREGTFNAIKGFKDFQTKEHLALRR